MRMNALPRALKCAMAGCSAIGLQEVGYLIGLLRHIELSVCKIIIYFQGLTPIYESDVVQCSLGHRDQTRANALARNWRASACILLGLDTPNCPAAPLIAQQNEILSVGEWRCA